MQDSSVRLLSELYKPPPPSPAGTEVQTFDTDTDEEEIEEEIDVKRKANEDIIREEIIKYFSNRR